MYSHHRRQGGTLVPLIQVLSLVLVFALPAVWGSKVFTSTPMRYDRVVVHSGDTVWSLVSHRSTRSDDLGEAVYRVSQINHIQAGARLQPGSILLFPSR
jgi:hypothetical protein